MRTPEIIETEIQDLNKVCLNAEKLSLQFPDDGILKIIFEKFIFRKTKLLKELEISTSFFSKFSLKNI